MPASCRSAFSLPVDAQARASPQPRTAWGCHLGLPPVQLGLPRNAAANERRPRRGHPRIAWRAGSPVVDGSLQVGRLLLK